MTEISQTENPNAMWKDIFLEKMKEGGHYKVLAEADCDEIAQDVLTARSSSKFFQICALILAF